MFNLFKKKSQVEKLNDKYKRLLAESHRLSTKNRKESDAKYAEADEVLQQIEALNNK